MKLIEQQLRSIIREEIQALSERTKVDVFMKPSVDQNDVIRFANNFTRETDWSERKTLSSGTKFVTVNFPDERTAKLFVDKSKGKFRGKVKVKLTANRF